MQSNAMMQGNVKQNKKQQKNNNTTTINHACHPTSSEGPRQM
jgi:hypothetical protein